MEQTCRCLCSLLLFCVRSRGVRSSGQVPGQSTFTFLVTSTSQVSGHLPDHHRVESFSRPETNRVKIRCSSHNTFLPLCSRDTRRWVVKRTTESRVGERAGCLCFLTPTCDGIPECAHRHSILKWHFSAHVVTRPSLAQCLFLEQTHGHSQCASLVCFYVLSQLLHEFCIPILLLHQLCIPSNRNSLCLSRTPRNSSAVLVELMCTLQWRFKRSCLCRTCPHPDFS